MSSQGLVGANKELCAEMKNPLRMQPFQMLLIGVQED